MMVVVVVPWLFFFMMMVVVVPWLFFFMMMVMAMVIGDLEKCL